MRARSVRKKNAIYVFCVIAVAIGVISLIGYRRNVLKAQDKVSVSDLFYIEGAILDYYADSKQLPESLEAVSLKGLTGSVGRYEYRKKSGPEDNNLNDWEYEICTTFRSKGVSSDTQANYPDYSQHGAGYQCFKVDAFQKNLSRSKYGS